MVEKKRIEWLDSLKALAVILVVIGHSINLLGRNLLIKRIIYLFHMPLFFMISGITYEMFSKKNNKGELKKLFVKREMSLFIPTIVFTSFNVIFRKNLTIFDYYNGVWFLIFLAFIIMIAIAEDNWSLNGKNRKNGILFLSGIIWIAFGVLQLILIWEDKITAAKFSNEISKFGGYVLCFYVGTIMIKNKNKFMKINSMFFILCIIFIGLMMLSVLVKLDDNIALTKITCGIVGGVVLTILYSERKKECTYFGEIIAAYSLEIYLIHVNIIHETLLPMIPYQNFSEWMKWVTMIFVTMMDICVPLLFVYLSKYIKIFKFIFHPFAFFEKMKSNI